MAGMGAKILESLWLTGFMGAGKSSVGAALAHRWDCPFADTDKLVEAVAGHTVSEVFKEEGEAGFRRREAAVFQSLWFGPPTLVALGGGTLTIPDVRETLVAGRAHLIWLRLPWEAVLSRVDGNGRPLWAQGRDNAYRLFRDRERVYQALAEFTVDAQASVEEVAVQVAKWAEAQHYVG